MNTISQISTLPVTCAQQEEEKKQEITPLSQPENDDALSSSISWDFLEDLSTQLEENTESILDHLLKVKFIDDKQFGIIRSDLLYANSQLTSNIADRIFQIELIKQNRFETSKGVPLSNAEILHMAIYCELKLPKIQGVANRVLEPTTTKLARTIQYNSEQKIIFISANQAYSAITGSGTTKKVVAAIGLLENRNKIITAANVFTYKKLDAEDIILAKHEIDIIKEFQGKPGFIKAHMLSDYTDSAGQFRTSLILESAEGDLLDMVQYPDKFDALEQKSIIKDLVYGLYQMHKRGYFHGDLKPDNCLRIIDADTYKTRAAIIDFDFTRKLINGKLIEGQFSGRYSQGYYGSVRFTAPEIFEQQDFDDDHFKAESYALGYTFREITEGYENSPPWQSGMQIMFNEFENDYTKTKNRNSSEGRSEIQAFRQKFKTQLQDMVSQKLIPINAKLKKDPPEELEDKEILDYLIYNLMHPNVEERWDMEQAKEWVDKHCPPPYVLE